MTDNFDISAKTMKLKMGEIDKDLLDSDICWMVTDNLEGILGYKLESEFNTEVNTYEMFNKYLHDNITTDHLLIIVL